MTRGALVSAALALIPLGAIAEDAGSARMKACAEMLREAAKSADEAQRNKLLSTAKLYDKSAEGFSGTFAQGLDEAVEATMPETVDDCLPDLKQLR